MLLGATHYAPAVDIWSVACIFAELARKVGASRVQAHWLRWLHTAAGLLGAAAQTLLGRRHVCKAVSSAACHSLHKAAAPVRSSTQPRNHTPRTPWCPNRAQQAIFPGDSELQQLLHIFKLLGTPSEEVWPNVTKLRDWHEFPNWHPQNLSTVGLGVGGSHARSQQGLQLLLCVPRTARQCGA